VIVESRPKPGRSRAIWATSSSSSRAGHIRDLPERAADIPEFKKEKWARLGVDVEHDFQPLYIVDPDKKKKVSELKKLLAGAASSCSRRTKTVRARRSPGTCSKS